MYIGNTVAKTGSQNVKGAWTQITASAGVSIEQCHISLSNGGGARQRFLVDVAVGAAGAETALLSNMAWDCESGVLNRRFSLNAPIRLKEGERVSFRAQSDMTATTCATIGISLRSTPFFNLPSMDDWDTYGADTATSLGVVVTQANTWSEIAASTRRDARWLMIYLSGNSHTVNRNYETSVTFGIGASGSEIPMFFFTAYTIGNGLPNSGFNPKCVSIPCNIPAGTRIAMKVDTQAISGTNAPSFVVCLGD